MCLGCVNETVRNNPEKFPLGYVFEFDKYEKRGLVENFDWFNSLKHRDVATTAYTEKGLYMFATISRIYSRLIEKRD